MKRLLVTPTRCTGCRTCEIACAFSHPLPKGAPGRSAIRAFALDTPNRGLPVVCLQCAAAACVTVCPTKALTRNRTTGAIVFAAERCIRCRSCAAACPFGNITFDEATDRVVKCDLCNGEPRCAQFCPTRTLAYV
jgi:anaerobic carbon-monoxide dehydrogenase iron sulfur subunit